MSGAHCDPFQARTSLVSAPVWSREESGRGEEREMLETESELTEMELALSELAEIRVEKAISLREKEAIF